MQKLYQASDRIEAQLVSDLLASRHIDNRILGNYLSGAIGELPADLYPTVWVIDDADLPLARELLTRFIADNRERGDASSWVCRDCGELIDGSFDLCWRCGGGRDQGRNR
jgi:hypothetical protein